MLTANAIGTWINTNMKSKQLLISLVALLAALASLVIPYPPGTVAFAAAPPWIETPFDTIDLVAGAGSSHPGELYVLGDILFFSADDSLGRELWKLLPPYKLVNASRVADIMPGDSGSNPSHLTSIDDKLFFSANDGTHGYEIWRTEPPYNRAYMVADINPFGDSSPTNLIAIGNTLFFKADDGVHGPEIWRTSPPYLSTQLVKDIWPGTSGSDPKELLSIGWTLLFSANDSTGREVWASDPPYDASNTHMVKDIYPGGGDSGAKELTRVGNILFFAATDGTGRELYWSKPPFDDQRTQRANEIDYLFPSDPSSLMAIGENIFFSANIGTSGYELRRSESPYDVERTYRVQDIYPGFIVLPPPLPTIPQSSFPQTLGSAAGTLFFTAVDGIHGRELWKSDPPYEDAWLVKDILPGPGNGNIKNLVGVGSVVFFSADDGSHGIQLWKSVPPYEADYTTRVTDLIMDASGIGPSKVVPLGNHLFFTAWDKESGYELRSIKFDTSGLPNTGFAPGILTDIPMQPASLNYIASDQMTLTIPALNLTTPLVGVPQITGNWNVTWLGSQTGYLDGTAFPTTPGNSVITGHSYLSNGMPGPLANLYTLKWGDQILITAWGQRYIYEIREISQTTPGDLRVLKKHEKLSWVTLITCQGFDEKQNQYRNRLVVRAVLIKVEPENY